MTTPKAKAKPAVAARRAYKHLNDDALVAAVAAREQQLEAEHYSNTLALVLTEATPVVIARVDAASEEEVAQAQAAAKQQQELQVLQLQANLQVIEAQLDRLAQA